MPWTTPPTERSIPCNGELIEYFRKQQGKTQQNLADEAGYTKRLIAKAEAGGSLSPDAIEILAETLSSNRQAVYPEDLTTSPKELAIAFLRSVWEHEEEAVSRCRHFMAAEMEVNFPGGPEAAPLSGLHVGPDAYENFMRKFFEIFQRPDKKLAEQTTEITTNGNHVVAVFFERLANEFIPPGAPAGLLVLNFHFAKGQIITLDYIFDAEVFGQVVTMWRENLNGFVNHDKNHTVPVRKRIDR